MGNERTLLLFLLPLRLACGYALLVAGLAKASAGWLTNPLLAAPDEDAFVARLLGGLGTFPPYFLRLGELNRHGPALPGPAGLTRLCPEQVAALRLQGAEVIDVRTPAAYAAGHLPGSLSITLRSVFATWLGWLVPDPGTPLVVVRDPDQDPEEIVWQARKVGHDNVAGELLGGIEAWRGTGRSVAVTVLASPGEVDPTRIVDVRQASEFASGHVPAARSIELGALATHDLPAGPLVTMCGHGERAATGASLLERRGRRDVAVMPVGPQDWADATGGQVQVGG